VLTGMSWLKVFRYESDCRRYMALGPSVVSTTFLTVQFDTHFYKTRERCDTCKMLTTGYMIIDSLTDKVLATFFDKSYFDRTENRVSILFVSLDIWW
jgi:hypothetical protein